jgi:short-subunit dehydrogenase
MNATSEVTSRPLAVVTGASSGIGFHLARKLADRGYDLVVVSSNEQKLSDAVRELSASEQHPNVESVQADLRKPGGVKKLYDRVQELQRPVDLLAANAGVGVHGEFAEDTELMDEIDLINLNVTSQVHLIKLVSHDMVERGTGDILITSSVAGVLPGPRMAVYAASKAFLRSFGQGIREELKDQGVNVTVLMPGATDTDFFERADMEDTVVGQASKDDPADVADEALDAVMKGAGHIVTGAKNKVQVAAAKLMPDETQAKVHAKQTRPKKETKKEKGA